MPVIRVHLDRISDLDPLDPKVPKKLQIIPKPQPQSTLDRKLLESGLRVYSKLDRPDSRHVGACLDFKDDPASTIVPMGRMRHATMPVTAGRTLATGPSASAGGAGLLAISAGFFVSPTPGATPIGLYGSIDIGIVLNFTASVAWQLMLYLLPPNLVYGGPPVVTVGVNYTSPGVKIGGGGFLIFFDRRPSPLELIGFGFQITAGVGVLPVDLFMTKSVAGGTV